MPLPVYIILLIVGLIAIGMTAAYALTPERKRERALRKVVRQISRDSLRNVVVPDGVDGEIVIDTLLLTAHGLLVLEVKRVDGAIFGGERLDNWTAIATDGRKTFANPVALMRQRVIALRTLYNDLPINGRVVFIGDVTLGADLPAVVVNLAGLRDEFAASRSNAEKALIDAFYSRWDELRRLATA